MKINAHHVGATLALGMAGATLLLSTGSYARTGVRQKKADAGVRANSSNYLEGTQKLIGKERIAGSDPRFAPSAMAILGGLDGPGDNRIGKVAFTKKQVFTGGREFFFNEETLVATFLNSASSRIRPPRPLSPTEELLLRTLFAKGDFSHSRGLTLTHDGIVGELTPENAGMSAREFQSLVEAASARARSASAAAKSF